MSIQWKHAITDSNHFISESEVVKKLDNGYIINYQRTNYQTGERLGFTESFVNKDLVTKIIE